MYERDMHVEYCVSFFISGVYTLLSVSRVDVAKKNICNKRSNIFCRKKYTATTKSNSKKAIEHATIMETTCKHNFESVWVRYRSLYEQNIYLVSMLLPCGSYGYCERLARLSLSLSLSLPLSRFFSLCFQPSSPSLQSKIR